MIVNVRGANGSGKTTVVRRVLEAHERQPIYVEGRSRPIGYSCTSMRGAQKLLIPGSYENPTGGCDTITDARLIYDMVANSARDGADVLFEGIVAQHNTTRLIEIHREMPIVAVVLTTTLEQCVESVLARRHARGNFDEFNPKNVEKEWKSVRSSMRRLQDAGARVLELDREAAFEFCLRMLKGEEQCAA